MDVRSWGLFPSNANHNIFNRKFSATQPTMNVEDALCGKRSRKSLSMAFF
jgi:hypothetical protein